MSKDDHGRCPNCNADLNGGSIWATGYEFAQQGKHFEQKGVGTVDVTECTRMADDYAQAYGAGREHGQWGRAIAIYDRDKDRTVMYQCPDCNHERKR